LILSNRCDRKFKTIYYVYPFELGQPPVQWDVLFSDVNVQFLTELPDLKFWDNVERHSLIVIDDLWSEACENADTVKCFKVIHFKNIYSRPIYVFRSLAEKWEYRSS